mgnify:CR=1 FL=1
MHPICYCHNYSLEDIRQEVLEQGYSIILDNLTAAQELGICQCEKLHPEKRPCIPDVCKIVELALRDPYLQMFPALSQQQAGDTVRQTER